ncbi:L,D-transpeptidase family protein [Paracoccus suum]|uniref:L,D-transpeptidase family protein n=1 Tax=Paracoccus suum TaxID=2259340 RepID=UPI001F540BBC|nr:L,D-transpeptidase [Paracoccus suum]
MPACQPLSRLALLMASAALSFGAVTPAAAQAPASGRPATAGTAAPVHRAPIPRPAAAALAASVAAAGDSAATPAAPARVVQPNTPFLGSDIEAAPYTGGDLPDGRSPITAKVQVLLDRAGISPGVVDGFKGGMSTSAIKAFERKLGLPTDGVMDPEVWAQLQQFMSVGPLTQTYTITDADAADLVESIPTDYAEKAKMERLGYTSVAEKLGERFHMDDKFIAFLNPGVDLKPGATITVVTPAKPIKAKVTRIIVDKASGRVAAYDAGGKLVVDFPATVGSTDTPSPSGKHFVEGVATNPNYTYNPNVNFKQGKNDKVLTIPPGPNGPVGSVWIDLDKPTYGIHGTSTPSRLFRNESHGCVRLTNWDAEELSHMVKAGTTMVEFLEPGQTIADVTDKVVPPPPAAAAANAAAVTEPATTEPATTAPAATAPATAAPAPSTPTAPAGTLAPPAPATPGALSADPLAAAIDAASGGDAPVQPVQPTPSTTDPAR